MEFSFAQKETEILKMQAQKKAELDAGLHVLKSHKAAAAALAEAHAWEVSVHENRDPQQLQVDDKTLSSTAAQRTKEYAEQHSRADLNLRTLQEDAPEPMATPAKDNDGAAPYLKVVTASKNSN